MGFDAQSRVIQGIVTGLGFIGAGSILKLSQELVALVQLFTDSGLIELLQRRVGRGKGTSCHDLFLLWNGLVG
mgnify:CR=1 FL=1